MQKTLENSSSPAKLVTEIRLRPNAHEAFVAWERRWTQALEGVQGFISRQTIPSAGLDNDTWCFVTRFGSPAALQAWRSSPVRAQLLADARPFLAEDGFGEVSSYAADEAVQESSVTEVIMDRVQPGKVEAYQDWARRIQEAQQKTGGYVGGYTQPVSGGDDGWLTLMRFATVEDLNRWMRSPERVTLMAEGKELITQTYTHQVDTAFPGWVPIDPSTGEGPPNWKTNLLVLLGLYPIVALESLFLVPILIPMSLHSAGLFIGNFLSVAATGFVTMPLFVRWFGWWLFPPKGSLSSVTLKGVAILLVIFAIQIATFWNLLK